MFNNQINKSLKIKEGYINIPKNYLWCTNCDALTPHKQSKNIIFSWQEYYRYCIICDNEIDIESFTNCPKCGWDYGPFYEDIPKYEIQVHLSGCHYNPFNSLDINEEIISIDYDDSYARVIWNRFINKYPQFVNIENIRCSCPKYLIITDPYCYKSSTKSVFSMNCSNSVEWTLLIRCPICGERFEINDGNC